MCQIGFSYPSGAEKKHIAFLNFDGILLFLGRIGGRGFCAFFFGSQDTLVVVVNGDGKNALCILLPDDIFIQHCLDFHRAGERLGRQRRPCLLLVRDMHMTVQKFCTGADAIIANIDIAVTWGGDEEHGLIFIATAKGTAAQPVFRIFRSVGHKTDTSVNLFFL